MTVQDDDTDPAKDGYVIAVTVSDDPVHGWKDALGKPLVSADFIYHTADLPTGGNYRRSVAIEKLEYNADGTIDKIVPTASGITHDSYALQSHKDRDHYLRHSDKELKAEKLNSSASYDYKWHLVPGLNGDKSTVSIQSENRPGYYITRVDDGGLTLTKHDGTEAFEKAATFEPVAGLSAAKAVSYKVPGSESYLKVANGKLTVGQVNSAADRKAATFTKQVAE